MLLDTNFRGRLLQLIEALDYGDAVSNQAIALDVVFKELGMKTAIYSQSCHSDVENLRSDLNELEPTDEDILVIHYSGYSKHIFPLVQSYRCTKICVYHNITPHEFFEPASELYELCLNGRQQLREVVRECHYFWGDSSYNLQELIELGANPRNCHVLPIIVGKKPVGQPTEKIPRREHGAWLFIGRVAASKGHIDLIELFATVRRENSSHARKLYIVGNYDEANPYFQRLEAQIVRLELREQITFTGKISDAEVEEYLARASVYVSMSEHEGFAVPLIEAAHYHLPVVALRNTAVGETMGYGPFLADSKAEMAQHIRNLLGNENTYREAVEFQNRNATRFSRDAVTGLLCGALKQILPDRFRFSTVSIVICTLDRSDLLERCLDYLQYQTNQNFEVIVVNGPSTDDTAEVLKRYKHRIKVAHNPKRNLAASRNIGIESSDGDLIAFIDDDALPFDDWVDTLIREFRARPLTHAALGGPAYLAGTLEFQSQDIGINKLAVSEINMAPGEIGSEGWERSLLGTNCCFRADIIRDVRGFDEQFDYFLDESELTFRLQRDNYIVGYVPDLFLRHEFAKSDNRAGKYKFNWFTICKNIAYFISAYSGLSAKESADYINRRMEIDRIAPLEAGFKAGDISKKELDEYILAIRSGAAQGLIDAKHFPRTRDLAPPPDLFGGYTRAPSYPIVGRDVDALHICIITKEFPPFLSGGGIGTLYYHLASELLLMGHHVTVILPGDPLRAFTRGRLSVHYEPPCAVCTSSNGTQGFVDNVNWSISALNAASQVHAEHAIDVIDSALWDSEALAISLIPSGRRPPLVLRLVTPFPVAARANGWSLSGHESALFRTAEQTLIGNADAVIPISESIARTIEDEYQTRRDRRWVSSYCGIAYWPSFHVSTDYSELKSINGKTLVTPREAKLVVFIGRLERRKGIDLLLAAAGEFIASDQLAHLVLAGKDVEGWSKSTSADLPSEIAHRIHFVGEIDDVTRDKLLHAAYCVVFPSRYESFGLVPLEAFVHGTPVVATNAGAIPEVIVERECGLLFEPENSAALARCVTELLADSRLRGRLSAGARRRIKVFSSRQSAIRSVTLYATLVSKDAVREGITGGPATAVGDGRSFTYAGSHRRLLTQCGRRDGRWMMSTGAEGLLLHGLFIDLPPGKYRTRLFGQVNNVGSPNAYVDVLTNSGETRLASEILAEARDGIELVSVDFLLEDCAQVEIRLWVSADTELAIRRLSISSEARAGRGFP
jgi:glycosyltransferase involved in cell wall biosynthesis